MPHRPGRRFAAPLPIRLIFATALFAFGLAARLFLESDICAIYTATEVMEGQSGFRLGLAEQYTHFGTLQLNSEEVSNEIGQFLDSSITQVVAGYQFNQRFGLQVNLPVIYRSWRRPVGDGEIQNSSRGGIGDISLIGNFLAFDHVTDGGVFRFGLLGGLTLPSGDSGFLKEEFDEDDGDDGDGGHTSGAARPLHGGEEHDAVASGIHGHDLTFGSGSVDGVVGAQFYHSIGRFFWTAILQYTITTEGSYEYQFANDLTWQGGPGAYVVLDHDYTLALQAAFTGETKGEDTQAGRTLDDTAVTNLFVGPAINFTWTDSLSAEVDVDLPVIENNTALQIVPDYRVRGAVVWRF